MNFQTPDYLDPTKWLDMCHNATATDVQRALNAQSPTERDLAALISKAAEPYLETMARKSQAITRRYFGRTIQLYAPLYLSSYCSGGCAYCGFASDREAVRDKLSLEEAAKELKAIKDMGIEEILLLTGERTKIAGYEYLREHVEQAAKYFHKVTIEVFPMSTEEYAGLVEAGCTGVTIYQETYDPEVYEKMHRWGPKKDYAKRIDATDRILKAGNRTIGLGALLGLSDPYYDVIALYRHALYLRKTYWKAGVGISFPRIRPETGGFVSERPVDEKFLTQIICALRICLPDAPMSLSTREGSFYRDHMIGLGPNKMSVASKTTVGGYCDDEENDSDAQFEVNDDRSAPEFCARLIELGYTPVFKNWDQTYRYQNAQ